MSELHTLIESEISKLRTLHALTMHRGPTDTEAKQKKAIKEMAYISALGTLNDRLKMTSQVFKGDKYLKEIDEFASELFLEGRNKSGSTDGVATTGIGQAYLDVSEILRATVQHVWLNQL